MSKIKIKKLVLLLIFTQFAFGQNIDSLWKVASKTSNQDTIRLAAYYDLAWEFVYSNPDSALAIAQTQLKYAQQTNQRKWQAKAYNAMGASYQLNSAYSKAVESYLKGIKVYELMGDKKNMAAFYGNIGSVYIVIEQLDKALEYQTKCLKIVQEIGHLEGVASTLNNISIIYTSMGNLEEAMLYSEQAIEMYKLIKDDYGLVSAISNLGEIYFTKEEYSKSELFYKNALQIASENKFDDKINRIKIELASIYFKQGKFQLAISIAEEVNSKMKEEPNIEIRQIALKLLADAYRKVKKYDLAFDFLKAYHKQTDSITALKNDEEIFKLEVKSNYERKVAADSVKNAEQKRTTDALIFAKNTQIENDRLQKIALYGGLCLMLISGAIMYNRFRVIQKQKNIIEAKNKETVEQKIIIEEKQKEILSSISYAKRLQEAILPPKNEISKHLPQSFIFYKPKDIVAGDFYWMECINDKILIAAADCTGHGVPGAMVSVVCSNALNRSVNEFDLIEPGKVLDKARELVVETFERSQTEVKDGMDISLCLIDKINNVLEWAGANNPLWIIRDKKLIELKPDKQAIGKVDNPIYYTTHKITLESNDLIYLFTDGFADQFGGEKGKKFKYKQLAELLVTHSALNLTDQQKFLGDTFENWKGQLEQVDDVCLIGIRI